jgi:hypothetical protein
MRRLPSLHVIGSMSYLTRKIAAMKQIFNNCHGNLGCRSGHGKVSQSAGFICLLVIQVGSSLSCRNRQQRSPDVMVPQSVTKDANIQNMTEEQAIDLVKKDAGRKIRQSPFRFIIGKLSWRSSHVFSVLQMRRRNRIIW